MLIEARAKINWTLDITGTREDGYHLMDMLMQPVTLHDDVILEPADTLVLTTGGFPPVRPNEKNLALRAARLLQEEAGITAGAAIHVHKRIPVGAGMAGGSADAAAVLWGLNSMWQLHYTRSELEQLGLRLGADVPFCLRGGLTRTTGIGEQLENLYCKTTFPLVVIQPCRGLSTAEVFKAYHEYSVAAAPDGIRHPDTEQALSALKEGNLRLLSRSASNVLQGVSEAKRPAIREAVVALREHGAAMALMTGSGSAVFGVYSDIAAARQTVTSLRSIWRSTYLTRTCTDSLIRNE